MSLTRYPEYHDSHEFEGYPNTGKTLIRQNKSEVPSASEHTYFAHLSVSRTCKKIYDNNLDQSYWSLIEKWIIETKAKKDYKDFFEKYYDDPRVKNSQIYKVLSHLNDEKVNNKSFINFFRHFPVLDQYIEDRNYHISILNDAVRLHLWHKSINLVLHFKSDFLIDFYSYDKDSEAHSDHLVYNMKGSFSSSSSLKKSYKIERLLALFDREKEDKNNYIWLKLYNNYFIIDSFENKKYTQVFFPKFKGKLVEK